MGSTDGSELVVDRLLLLEKILEPVLEFRLELLDKNLLVLELLELLVLELLEKILLFLQRLEKILLVLELLVKILLVLELLEREPLLPRRYLLHHWT